MFYSLRIMALRTFLSDNENFLATERLPRVGLNTGNSGLSIIATTGDLKDPPN